MARTRIVATLGPTSRTEATITALMEAGVDVFRLNFAHGTREEHGRTIDAIRRVAAGSVTAIFPLPFPEARPGHPPPHEF